MNIYKPTDDILNRAAEIIKSGGLVAFPTETVYGLGASGLDPLAVAKIFEAKNRPTFNPLILHVCDENQLEKICFYQNEKVNKLIAKFWPGPLTLVLPKKDTVPEIVTADNPTVAVRMPANEIALKLISKSGVPLAAPSANLFNQLSPTTAKHVQKQLGKRVDMILDGGNCAVGVESTILLVKDESVYLLRPGGLATEEIEKAIGKIDTFQINLNKPNSPGQLPFHYSPKIPLKIIGTFDNSTLTGKKVGALFFKNQTIDFPFADIRFLSPTGCLTEAAANLFAFLHEMELEDLDLIIAEQFELNGLGLAIMDRLNKAAKRFE